MIEYYLNGGCLELCLILKDLYPESNMYINFNKSHIVTEINGVLYDANGIVNDINNYREVTDFDIQYLKDYSNNIYKKLDIGNNILLFINKNLKNKSL